jgi:hypothetical protein
MTIIGASGTNNGGTPVDLVKIQGTNTEAANVYSLYNQGGFTNTIHDTANSHTYANTDAFISEYHLLANAGTPSFDDAYWGIASSSLGGPSGYLASIGKQSNGLGANQICLHFFCPQESHSTVTVNGAVSTDQNLHTLPISAITHAGGSTGAMNTTTGLAFHYTGAGSYTTTGTGAGTMVFKLHGCTVSGCATGTNVTLLTFQTTATQPNSQSSVPWMVDVYCATSSTGGSGGLRCYGNLYTNVTSPTALQNIYSGPITTTTTDLTVTENLQLTVADSGASANNTFAQNESILYPIK